MRKIANRVRSVGHLRIAQQRQVVARGRGPLELVFRRRVGERSLALRAEARIKRLQKADKERLAASVAFARRFFAALVAESAPAEA